VKTVVPISKKNIKKDEDNEEVSNLPLDKSLSQNNETFIIKEQPSDEIGKNLPISPVMEKKKENRLTEENQISDTEINMLLPVEKVNIIKGGYLDPSFLLSSSISWSNKLANVAEAITKEDVEKNVEKYKFKKNNINSKQTKKIVEVKKNKFEIRSTNFDLNNEIWINPVVAKLPPPNQVSSIQSVISHDLQKTPSKSITTSNIVKVFDITSIPSNSKTKRASSAFSYSISKNYPTKNRNSKNVLTKSLTRPSSSTFLSANLPLSHSYFSKKSILNSKNVDCVLSDTICSSDVTIPSPEFGVDSISTSSNRSPDISLIEDDDSNEIESKNSEENKFEMGLSLPIESSLNKDVATISSQSKFNINNENKNKEYNLHQLHPIFEFLLLLLF
jgi:hypothetical protein